MAVSDDTPLLRVVRTSRLNLVAATGDLIRADIAGRKRLARALSATVPKTWPPDLFGPGAMQFTLMHFGAAAEQGWSFWYLVTNDDACEVVGVCGFKGWPDEAGSVEISYSVLSDYQRRGFATEAVLALVAWAFSHHNVNEVCAETFPHLSQSISVLKKSGFVFAGEGSEAGVVRYVINRQNLN